MLGSYLRAKTETKVKKWIIAGPSQTKGLTWTLPRLGSDPDQSRLQSVGPTTSISPSCIKRAKVDWRHYFLAWLRLG